MSLLKLMKDMLFEHNKLLNRTYDVKKIMCSMSMDYEKIHSCPNDCILYRKDYEHLEKCSLCERSRYKRNDKFWLRYYGII